jgi:hypothetical protein
VVLPCWALGAALGALRERNRSTRSAGARASRRMLRSAGLALALALALPASCALLVGPLSGVGVLLVAAVALAWGWAFGGLAPLLTLVAASHARSLVALGRALQLAAAAASLLVGTLAIGWFGARYFLLVAAACALVAALAVPRAARLAASSKG